MRCRLWLQEGRLRLFSQRGSDQTADDPNAARTNPPRHDRLTRLGGWVGAPHAGLA